MAKQYFAAKELDNAKEQIDGYLDNMGSGDVKGWLLRAAIYTAISKNAQWKFLVPDSKMEAFMSIKKATVLDKRLVSNQLEDSKFSPLMDIYQGYVTEGIACFNTATETHLTAGYTKALDLFKNALSITDFVKQEGWQINWQPNLPSLQYNAAQAGINGGNEDAALLYSRQLADAGVVRTDNYKKGDFANIYQWLVNYYYTKQDGNNLQTYAALGVKNYPDSLYFTTKLLDHYKKTGQYTRLWPTYEKVLERFPQQFELLYKYCSDLFTYVYSKAPDKKAVPGLHQKLDLHLQQYIQHQSDSAKGYWLIGKYYFNRAVDLHKTGVKSDTIKRYLNQAVINLQTGILKYTGCDKALLKEIQLTICKALNGAAKC